MPRVRNKRGLDGIRLSQLSRNQEAAVEREAQRRARVDLLDLPAPPLRPDEPVTVYLYVEGVHGSSLEWQLIGEDGRPWGQYFVSSWDEARLKAYSNGTSGLLAKVYTNGWRLVILKPGELPPYEVFIRGVQAGWLKRRET